MPDNLTLPPGQFPDNTAKSLRSSEKDGVHSLHVNVDSFAEFPAPIYYLLSSIARPIWMDPTTGRLNINNVNTITSVSSANITQLGGFEPRQTLMYATERSNWSLNVRSRIS